MTSSPITNRWTATDGYPRVVFYDMLGGQPQEEENHKRRRGGVTTNKQTNKLQDRIKQHVPQWLRQQLTRLRRSQPHRSCKRNDTKLDRDSAIGQYLLENDQCALNYDDKRFSILVTARSSFHVNLLETAYIKTQRPVSFKQKVFDCTLKLFR